MKNSIINIEKDEKIILYLNMNLWIKKKNNTAVYPVGVFAWSEITIMSVNGELIETCSM